MVSGVAFALQGTAQGSGRSCKVQRLRLRDRVDLQNPCTELRKEESAYTKSLSYDTRRRGTVHKPTLLGLPLGMEAFLL